MGAANQFDFDPAKKTRYTAVRPPFPPPRRFGAPRAKSKVLLLRRGPEELGRKEGGRNRG